MGYVEEAVSAGGGHRARTSMPGWSLGSMPPEVSEDVPAAEDLAVSAVALARLFAAGATMWCVAPQWPAHARHVAVEFVHPVIVGKRALPAVHVEGVDVVGALRLLVRRGDVLLAIGSADNARTGDLLQRAQAWGLTRIWLGAGPRPPSGRAEHVAWWEGADPELAARSGDLVLFYHLLWELTHVVFEHSGLLEPEPECTEEACVTCSDEGRVAEVTAVLDHGTAQVLADGLLETLDTSLVGPVATGDLVLVHAGVALTVLSDISPSMPESVP